MEEKEEEEEEEEGGLKNTSTDIHTNTLLFPSISIHSRD